jgi:DNA-binding MarR family transcriptional regulator
MPSRSTPKRQRRSTATRAAGAKGKDASDLSPAERVLRAFQAFRAGVLRDPMRQTIKFLHQRNLSFASVATVMALREHGNLSISQLAHETGLSLAATSQLVERLVQERLAVRTEHGTDRRRKQVALTPKGRDFMTRMDATYLTSAGQKLDAVPDALLTRLVAALEAVIAEVNLLQS